MELNRNILSHVPKSILTEAVNNPKSSKRKLVITIIGRLTGEPEEQVARFLNEEVTFELDTRKFRLNV